MAAAVIGILGRRLQPRAGQLPTIQTVRHASKAVTRHVRVMHFERQKLMALTQYIPPKPAIPTCCLPPAHKPLSEESGLTQLLKREVIEVFRKNRMIAVCQNVALSAEDKLLVKHQLRKHNIFVKVFPNSILRPFLAESKYQNLLPLFVGHNMLLVSSEPKAKEMLRVLRSVPVLPLLGGCIDDTILSYQGFLNYSKLPSQSLMQSELVGGLSLLTAQTHSLLQRQPLQLTTLLEQYLRQQHGEGSTASSPAEPASSDLVTDT